MDAPSADSEVPIGRIVNLSSILGSLALHSDPKSPIYGMKGFACDASKTSLNAFTVRLAPELRGTPFKVNSAHPGWVKTDMGDQAAPMEVLGGQDERAPTRPNPACGPTSSSR
jgi:NAD(P)-dependent dehydrogenase (short-subunit alcohol dehydrogenase family)